MFPHISSRIRRDRAEGLNVAAQATLGRGRHDGYGVSTGRSIRAPHALHASCARSIGARAWAVRR